MREYAKLAPTFWTGETGKALRKRGTKALLVAAYLVSSPTSNMLGLYYQPILYMAHETGLGIEGASEGLEHCIACGFCDYDRESEFVFVFEMAKWQISESLKATDLRCKGIQKDYEGLPPNPFLGAFFDRYSSAFHLIRRRSIEEEKPEVDQAPSKPHRSQEQEQEQEQEVKGFALVGGADVLPRSQPEALVDLYHEVLPELPRVRLMNDKRRKALSGFWKWILTTKKPDGSRRAQTADQALTWARDYFTRARENDFLMGRTQRAGEHANWQCDLDFLLTDRGLKHVIEKTREAA